jgi:hypothetical protein
MVYPLENQILIQMKRAGLLVSEGSSVVCVFSRSIPISFISLEEKKVYNALGSRATGRKKMRRRILPNIMISLHLVVLVLYQ